MNEEISSLDIPPWYKQFWPWLIISLPLTAVIAGLTTVFIAFNGQDPLVRDDWYKAGKAVNQDVSRDQTAKAMQLTAELSMIENGVAVIFNQKINDGQLLLSFYHPTLESRDRELSLSRVNDQEFRAGMSDFADGEYHIFIEATSSNADAWRLSHSRVQLNNQSSKLELTPFGK